MVKRDVGLVQRADSNMCCSYAVDIDFKPLGITPETVSNDAKRTEARKTVKKLFQEKYTAGKNKWFFSKLRF